MDYYTIPNIILIITLLVVPSCVSMPNGPPESACQDMRPRSRMGEVHIEGHTTMPQNILPTYGRKRQPPFYFQIHLNKTGPLKDRFEYYPDVPIAVSVVANASLGHNYFKGVFIQARKLVCFGNSSAVVEETPLGDFSVNTVRPPRVLSLQTRTCGGRAKSALSHLTRTFKVNETFNWIPRANDGHVIFKATIVQTEKVYWTNLFSSIIQDSQFTHIKPMKCNATKSNYYVMFIIALVALAKISK